MSQNGGPEALLACARLGNNLAEKYVNQPVDFETPVALKVMLHLERVLDVGGVVVDLLEDIGLRSEITQAKDVLRDNIVKLMRHLGKSEVERLLSSEGENLKLYFAEAAFKQ
jgi:hypothetical protein